MTTHGVLDCRFSGSYVSQGNLYTEMYVSATKFLNSSYATAVGITRIACNFGTGSTGEGYVDEALHVGQNPWSVYEFSSAATPFYMLLQANATNNCSSSTSGRTLFDGSPSVSGFAVSFAMRADGGITWNGTLANNGTDVKGVTIWAGGVQDFYAWPRSNSPGGTHSTIRDNMMGIPITRNLTNSSPLFGCRMSILCDENNIVFLTDDYADSRYRILYFGKYTPRSDMSPAPDHPYVCLRNASVSNQSLDFATYGTLAGDPNGYEGGVAHPHSVASGTYSVATTSLSGFWSQYYQPSTVTSSTSSYKFDEMPVYIAMNEFPHSGYLGTVDWIRYCWGPDVCSVNADASRAYFGNNTHNNTRLSVPWNPVVYPGTGYDRAGRMF